MRPGTAPGIIRPPPRRTAPPQLAEPWLLDRPTSPRRRAAKRGSVADQVPRNLRLQELRRQDEVRVPSRDHRRRRPQRLRQVQRGRRHPLGDGRAVAAPPARQGHGGRDLRGRRGASSRRSRRGRALLRQLRRRRPAGLRRLLRDPGRAPAVPLRRVRVPDQQGGGAPARRAGLLPGHRHRHPGLHHRRAGPHRRDRVGQARGSPRADRGGGGHQQVQGAPPGGGAQARGHRAESGARERRAGGDPPPDPLDRAPGQEGRALPPAAGPPAAARAVARRRRAERAPRRGRGGPAPGARRTRRRRRRGDAPRRVRGALRGEAGRGGRGRARRSRQERGALPGALAHPGAGEPDRVRAPRARRRSPRRTSRGSASARS